MRKKVTLMTKIKFHEAIPMCLALHGSKNWSGNESDLEKIDVFIMSLLGEFLALG